MLKIPAIITKVTTMSDGGLRLQVDTQEMNGNTKGQVMDYHQKFGYFIFADEGEQVIESDIPTEKLEFPNQKSQSLRLRNVIYRLWEQDHGGYEDFELYYRAKTEKIIVWLKEKLN